MSRDPIFVTIYLPSVLHKFICAKVKRFPATLNLDKRIGSLIWSRLSHNIEKETTQIGFERTDLPFLPRKLDGMGCYLSKNSQLAIERELDHILRQELWEYVYRHHIMGHREKKSVILEYLNSYDICDEDWKFETALKFVNRRKSKLFKNPFRN